MDSTDQRYRVPAVDKTMAILDLLARSGRSMGVSELGTALHLPKATVFMILATLEGHRVVHRDGHGCYAIGVRLFELGGAYLNRLDLATVARPHLEQLMLRLGLTVHLGVFDRGQLVFIAKFEPQSFVRFSTYPGMRQPLHTSSLGKALAAYLPLEDLEGVLASELVRLTERTITTPEEFRAVLEEVRARGYSVEDGEAEPNVRCIGAPVFDAGGLAGAISVTALASQLPVEQDAAMGAVVAGTAARISHELGSEQVGAVSLLTGEGA